MHPSIQVAAYQSMNPKYKKKGIIETLKERLVQEVGDGAWEAHWPKLCNESYYNSFRLPDTVNELTDAQLAYMEFPGHGPNRTLENLTSVDVDHILRNECRLFTDPTVAKNEAHLRYHVKEPELEQVQPYVEGKPYFMWYDHDEEAFLSRGGRRAEEQR